MNSAQTFDAVDRSTLWPQKSIARPGHPKARKEADKLARAVGPARLLALKDLPSWTRPST
ncbi:hypothetical protein GGQ85_001061 [Nitrobacter vulgaris]|nr:hypothetical protein [Nitrobacter vulgaris]